MSAAQIETAQEGDAHNETLASATSAKSTTRCGFVALLGASNSGKSTLLNQLIGQKIAIVTPKVQTTRCRVLGILSNAAMPRHSDAEKGNGGGHDKVQIIFQDTPGVFQNAHSRMDRAMVASAWHSGHDADLIALVIDAAQIAHDTLVKESSDLFAILKALAKMYGRAKESKTKPLVLVLNKTDLLTDAQLEAVRDSVKSAITTASSEHEDQAVLLRAAAAGAGATYVDDIIRSFSVSALKGSGCDELVRVLAAQMPRGPYLFPEDFPTDMPMRSVAAEVTREKLMLLLKQELPYAVAVETVDFKERDDGSFAIRQNILVERNSQKLIVVGKSGAMIKKLGIAAREEMQAMLDAKVHLFLDVKVKRDWKESKQFYDSWGLAYDG